MVKYVTMRMVISLTKYFNWPLDPLDNVTAFVYGVMEEVVHCVAPERVELDKAFDCLELVKTSSVQNKLHVCGMNFRRVCMLD